MRLRIKIYNRFYAVIAGNGIICVLYYTGRFEKRVWTRVPNLYVNKGRRRIDQVAAMTAAAAHIRRTPAALVGETVVATSPTPPPLFCNRMTVETTVIGCLQQMRARNIINADAAVLYVPRAICRVLHIYQFITKMCGLQVAQSWSQSRYTSKANKLK